MHKEHTIESSKIKKVFEKIESNYPRFLEKELFIWHIDIEKYLSDLEEKIDDQKLKYFSWFVSLMKDIFAYNDIKKITSSQLKIIKKGIDIICENEEECTKKLFEKFHLEVIESGLEDKPITQKSIDKLGV